MKYSRVLWSGLLLLACAASAQQAAPGNGTDTAALEQKVRDLEDRLVMLEGQVRQLKAQGPAAPSPNIAAPVTPASAEPSQVATTPQGAAGYTATTGDTNNVRLGGAGGAASKALNPDVSVIGDFIGSAGHNPVNSTPSFQMHESEIGLQAIIDPYARGDFFISFGETGVNLEEGFITFTALPAGFVAKGGKMRAAFGKVNTLHNHVLPWVDRPLVTQNLVGGEDGIDDAGLSIEHIIPAPRNWFLDFTGQVFRGDSADVYTSSNKNDVSVVGHLRGYHDLTDNSNLASTRPTIGSHCSGPFINRSSHAASLSGAGKINLPSRPARPSRVHSTLPPDLSMRSASTPPAISSLPAAGLWAHGLTDQTGHSMRR
jgi:hypothetical protein